MHLFSPKTAIVILALTVCAASFVSVERVDQPAIPLSVRESQDPVPLRWRKTDAYGKFTFYLPPEMRDTGIVGIENLHREYTNGRMHLSFDYEPYGYLAYENRALAFGRNYQEVELQVDGRKAYLFLYRGSDRKNRRTYNANLYVGDLPNGDVILHMWMSTRSARYVETAKTIFQTIKFSS